MKATHLRAIAATVLLSAASLAAHADYVFSGSGAAGNLAPGAEVWRFNYSGVNNWGSPGVGAGSAAYSRAEAAYGFDISFAGATIQPSSIAIGNGAGCAGNDTGGTTFCTNSPVAIWIATLLDANTIAFRAQNPGLVLTPGETYFVNVLFAGSTPTSFTGRWVTQFSPDAQAVPEPSVLALLGLGMLGLAWSRRRAG